MQTQGCFDGIRTGILPLVSKIEQIISIEEGLLDGEKRSRSQYGERSKPMRKHWVGIETTRCGVARIPCITNAKWYGAPAPLYCDPKTDYPFSGSWDHAAECDVHGQTLSSTAANSNMMARSLEHSTTTLPFQTLLAH